MKKTSEPEEPKIEEKIFYIIIVFSKIKEIEIKFEFKTKTEIIHSNIKKLDKGFRYYIILKHIFIPQNHEQKVEDLTFNLNSEIFKVSFKLDEYTFIFNPILKIKKNRTANEISFPKNFKITEKIKIFSEYLEKSNENSKLETLYNDSLNFFNSNQEKDFELIIYLFFKLCHIQNFKNICKKLLKSFWDNTTNDKIKNLINQNESCKEFLEDLTDITINTEKFENGLDKSTFYGLILYYLNNYYPSLFKSLSKKLQEKEENEKIYFSILVHYSSIFSNDFDINLERYINFLIEKDFKTLEISVIEYFKEIEEFIYVMNKTKISIINMKNFKTLRFPKNPNYNLKNPEQFIKELGQIIYFSQDQKKLLLFLPGNFWKRMTETLEKLSNDNNNIDYLFHLRENFKKYFKVVKEIYNNNKGHPIYKDAEETNEKDEIAILLNRIIQNKIEHENENTEIIHLIKSYDIYYKEDNYISRRELNFLDKINFDERESNWMEEFKSSNFEDIFSNDIENYILKLVFKIKKIEDFNIVIDIIDEDKIKKLEKIEYFIELLRKKALSLMKNFDSMKELNKENKDDKLSALTKLLKIIYKNSQKFEKIKDILNRLSNENKHIVHLELLKSFEDDKNLYEYIFEFYINNLNDFYKKIIELFEILNEDKIKDFMSKITNKKEGKKKYYHIISYDDFFMEKENLNLNLLKKLYKFEKIKKTFYYGESKKVLLNVYNNIDKKKLEIRHLKSLLSNKKDEVIERLELLTILNKPINANLKYEELKKKYEVAQKEINELKKISDAYKIFHNEVYKDIIKKIEEQIDKFNNGEINEFENISKLKMEYVDEKTEKKVETINKIKESSIFRKLFNNTQAQNQDQQFELALKNLKNEFNKLKKNKYDEKTKKEIEIIIDALDLKEDENTQKELKYMEDSSNAEEDIKNMIYFCENFKLNNNIEEKEESLENLLLKIYKDIKNNNEKKENLKILKDKNIYDYEKKGIHIEFFNLFYNQKEAIDFLLTKSHDNVEIIKDKLISIDNTVTLNDIDEVDNCIDFFNNELINSKNQCILFDNIKKINTNLFDNFKNFIKIFPYLVELDNNSDNSYNLYIKVKKYFSESYYIINLNYEKYSYINPENKEEKTIDLKEIKSIKHKINYPNEVINRLKENNEFSEGQEKISLEKTRLLIKFKEIVSNIELIEQFISVFQIKGCSLPIEIKINMKYPEEAKYFLKEKEFLFDELSKYLLNMKNYLEKTLDLNYKRQQNLRFLYGRQFNTLNKHILGDDDLPSFFRYILNNLNDKIPIINGIKSFPRTTQNYVEEYKAYSDDSFKIYNNYISSLMKENEINIEELYEKMKIKSNANDKLIYKGLFLYKSNDYSMEEDILKIFIEKTKNLPIAQNILISNKETSFEEIQAFFHRAILCRFNTLFAIEINDSLSDFQLKIIINFISQLLKYQLDIYNKTNRVKIDIKETNKYIEPLIIFVYNVKKVNEYFFI